MKAFENDTLLWAEITRLVREFKIESVIETGTEYGGTAIALSQMVSQVITCDVERKWESLPDNVEFILGDSRHVLPDAIKWARSPILFYLDAHNPNVDEECPLSEELEQISKSLDVPPVLVIHDALVPEHPELGYATYRGIPISYDAIHTQLDSIYHGGYYSHYHNSEALGAKRGVLFIIPTVGDS